MKLIEVFRHLTYGELAQVSLGGGALGEIQEADYGKVLSHINLGLTALYSRFTLKSRSISLPLEMGKDTYTLTEPDLLKIISVTPLLGKELPLNDPASPWSIKTPTASSIVVPKAFVTEGAVIPTEYTGQTFDVLFRAGHPILSVDMPGFDPETVEVELPVSHLQALLYFVAGRALTPFGASEGYSLGDAYLSRYEAACLQLETTLKIVDELEQPDRLRQKGWV